MNSPTADLPVFNTVDYSPLLESFAVRPYDGCISASRAYLHQDATEMSAVVDEVFAGSPFIIEKKEQDWSLIRTYYDYSGWIKNSQMAADGTGLFVTDALVTRPSADILSEPRYQSRRLTTLPAGSFIRLLPEEQDQWRNVCCADGTKGWIRSGAYTNLTKRTARSEAEVRQNLVRTALSYLDTQYRWGGKTIDGIDCSGLCSLAYLLNGFMIHRDSTFKENPLRSCRKDELKEGDLVYSPGHIMMYLGDERVLHASGTFGMVTVSSLIPGGERYLPQFEEIYGYATLF